LLRKKPPLGRGVVELPVPVPVGGRKPPAGRAGNVTPWVLRQATSAVRLAVPAPLLVLEAAVADAAAELVLVLVLEALPHAAIRPPAAITASASGTPSRALLIIFI
jgi:hypothetical protein